MQRTQRYQPGGIAAELGKSLGVGTGSLDRPTHHVQHVGRPVADDGPLPVFLVLAQLVRGVGDGVSGE